MFLLCVIEKGQESGGLGPIWAVGHCKNKGLDLTCFSTNPLLNATCLTHLITLILQSTCYETCQVF